MFLAVFTHKHDNNLLHNKISFKVRDGVTTSRLFAQQFSSDFQLTCHAGRANQSVEQEIVELTNLIPTRLANPEPTSAPGSQLGCRDVAPQVVWQPKSPDIEDCDWFVQSVGLLFRKQICGEEVRQNWAMDVHFLVEGKFTRPNQF